jgi:hypothetical protein
MATSRASAGAAVADRHADPFPEWERTAIHSENLQRGSWAM